GGRGGTEPLTGYHDRWHTDRYSFSAGGVADQVERDVVGARAGSHDKHVTASVRLGVAVFSRMQDFAGESALTCPIRPVGHPVGTSSHYDRGSRPSSGGGLHGPPILRRIDSLHGDAELDRRVDLAGIVAEVFDEVVTSDPAPIAARHTQPG